MSLWHATAYFPHVISALQQLSSRFRSLKRHSYEMIQENLALSLLLILSKLGWTIFRSWYVFLSFTHLYPSYIAYVEKRNSNNVSFGLSTIEERRISRPDILHPNECSWSAASTFRCGDLGLRWFQRELRWVFQAEAVRCCCCHWQRDSNRRRRPWTRKQKSHFKTAIRAV